MFAPVWNPVAKDIAASIIIPIVLLFFALAVWDSTVHRRRGNTPPPPMLGEDKYIYGRSDAWCRHPSPAEFQSRERRGVIPTYVCRGMAAEWVAASIDGGVDGTGGSMANHMEEMECS